MLRVWALEGTGAEGTRQRGPLPVMTIIIIIIIIDGSCIAQIFPSSKLNALAHAIHAKPHTDISII